MNKIAKIYLWLINKTGACSDNVKFTLVIVIIIVLTYEYVCT